MVKPYEKIAKDVRIRNFRETVENRIAYLKKQTGSTNFALLIYVNDSVYPIIREAYKHMDKSNIRAVIPDNPAAIFVILNEPVPFPIHQFLTQFYAVQMYVVEKEEIRVGRMAMQLKKLTQESPEAAGWFASFAEWYKDYYCPTKAGANDFHIEELFPIDNKLLVR